MSEKLYSEMTADEQIKWVTDLTEFAEEKLPILENLSDAWEKQHCKDMETGLSLINAFSYAREYVDTSLRFGDYSRRVYRLRYYIEAIKSEISQGLSMQGANGEVVAYIPGLKQSRRRGRPTKEEAVTAKQEGIDDKEVKRKQVIARLMGVDVVTDVKREKNNEELAAERELKERKEKENAPSLFDNSQNELKKETRIGNENESNNSSLINESSIASLSSTRPHLDQLSILLSDELKERVANVRSMRATAAREAELAKTLAEQGAKQDIIIPHTKEAQKQTEAYEQVYEDVDKELALLYKRLKDDNHFVETFKNRFGQNTDIDKLCQELKPYYNKATDDYKSKIEEIIAEENPALVAQRKAEAEKKAKVDAILKYLNRKDKPATAKRVQGMENKLKELETLIGKEEANIYLPLLEATRKKAKELEIKKADNKKK